MSTLTRGLSGLARSGVSYMVGAELEDDVGVGGVLEEVLEPHDVPVVELTVDPDLGLELLLAWVQAVCQVSAAWYHGQCV